VEHRAKSARRSPHPENGEKKKINGHPTLQEVQAFIAEKHYAVNAEKFMSHYEANGWRVGRNPMKDWQAAVRSWNASAAEKSQAPVYDMTAWKGGDDEPR